MANDVVVGTREAEAPEFVAGPRLRGATDPASGSRRPKQRDWSLDAIRGLAVALMLADHLLIWHPGLHVIRETVTRAAMPLFFLLSGHLVKRLSWRHLAIGVIGLVLPVVITFVDSPNVLLWYAVGAVIIVNARALGSLALLAFVVAPLTEFANYFDVSPVGTSYQPAALVGLMALGALLPRSAFAWGRFIPRPVALIGRYPLSVYVGHLVLIEVFVMWWRS